MKLFSEIFFGEAGGVGIKFSGWRHVTRYNYECFGISAFLVSKFPLSILGNFPSKCKTAEKKGHPSSWHSANEWSARGRWAAVGKKMVKIRQAACSGKIAGFQLHSHGHARTWTWGKFNYPAWECVCAKSIAYLQVQVHSASLSLSLSSISWLCCQPVIYNFIFTLSMCVCTGENKKTKSFALLFYHKHSPGPLPPLALAPA